MVESFDSGFNTGRSPVDAAGGGLVGIISTLPVSGLPAIEALRRMQWSGNGLGGGVALVGCFPRFRNYYAFSIALQPFGLRSEIERTFIGPYFDIHDHQLQPELDDHRQLPGLAARPPRVVRYFLRAKPNALDEFAARNGITDPAAAEDEFVVQCAYKLNRSRYTGQAGETAFVLSCGRDMMVVKGVGDADAVARFYRLDQQRAHIWLSNQHYPTCPHLGGSPPFAALNGAVAMDGSFTNRRAVVQYLMQRGYRPQFRADAELGTLLFDLYRRAYRYPLTLTLEALAPSSKTRLDRLSQKRRERYRLLQHTHAHGIPSGPIFLATAHNVHPDGLWQLAGAVDSDARRPNVFGLQEGVTGEGVRYGVGVIASEYQALETVFRRLASEHGAVSPLPDKVWTAREFGPEGTDDGGAYIFTLARPPADEATLDTPLTLSCEDKFGRFVVTNREQFHNDKPGAVPIEVRANLRPLADFANVHVPGESTTLNNEQIEAMYTTVTASITGWSFATLNAWLDQVVSEAASAPQLRSPAVGLLTRLYDRVPVYDTGAKKRSAVRARLQAAFTTLFNTTPTSAREADPADPDRRLTWITLATRGLPLTTRGTLYIDAGDLPLEGNNRLAQVLARAYQAGWRWFLIFGCKGDRLVGAGLGPNTVDVWIDVYGTPGDYLAAGLDGAEIHVHGPAQDHTGYLMKRGRLVIYGDVGQAFLYGATGGTAHVMGFTGARAFVDTGDDVGAIVSGIVEGAPTSPEVFITGGTAQEEDAAWQQHNRQTLLRQNAALFSY